MTRAAPKSRPAATGRDRHPFSEPKALPRLGWSVRKRIVRMVRVCPVTRCWDWQGGLVAGYGRLKIVVGETRRSVYAHRASYAVWVGEVPAGMTVHHSCNNTRCCNPDHLTLLSNGENVAEANGRNGFRGNQYDKPRCPEKVRDLCPCENKCEQEDDEAPAPF